ncbi:MAG: TAXI family TRAP transporter solute-binding subunit [Alphaproteobacteria bacterium]|jgi:hypothetical protein|nr:TAXI family TRAP transporter solute-binding subunit [Alphaproteobacteria bacterium]
MRGGPVLLAILLAALLAALSAAMPAMGQTPGGTPAPEPDNGKPTAMVIGGGRPFGLNFAAAGAVCRIAEAAELGRCLVESKADSAANLAALQDGSVDFAVVQSDWLRHAAEGTSRFRGVGADDDLRAMFSLHAEALTLVARAQARIRTVASLKRRRVGLGAADGYARLLMEYLLRAVGLDMDDLEAAADGTPAAVDAALCEGKLDAVALVASHPSLRMGALAERCPVRIVQLVSGTIARTLKGRPDLSLAVVPGGLYKGSPDPVRTIGLRAVLATTGQVAASRVYRLVAATFERLGELRGRHPALSSLRIESMSQSGIGIPVHEGALRFYRERGIRH